MVALFATMPKARGVCLYLNTVVLSYGKLFTITLKKKI